MSLPLLQYQRHSRAWTCTIVFSFAPTNDHSSWWCNGGEVKGREQDQGILRFGGQVWQCGEGGLTWLTECHLRVKACAQLGFSEG